MRFIFIHGYKSSPEKNFWPWLRHELQAQGHEVVAPELPNPEAPSVEEWIKAMLDATRVLTDQDIIVGHSLGGALALRFLEAAEARTTPHACLLISTPWNIKDERFAGFFLTEFDFEVLMWRASKFCVLHAADDAIIPVAHAKRYADIFHAELITPENGGHFNAEEYPIIRDTALRLAAEPIVYNPGGDLNNQYADIIK